MKSQIQNLIGNNRVLEALNLLATVPSLQNEVTLLKGRFSANERDSNLGIISGESYRLTRNQVIAAILHHADSTGGATIVEAQHPPKPMQRGKYTIAQIEAILDRENIEPAEIEELQTVAAQVLDFFRTKLSEDEYLEFCADAEMANRKFAARPKDNDRKLTLMEEISKMLLDYKAFTAANNEEGVLESLYNTAKDKLTIAAFEKYFALVLQKFTSLAPLDAQYKVEKMEHEMKVAGTGSSMAKRMFEKGFVEGWLHKIGRK